MTKPLPERERATGLVRADRTVLSDRYELHGLVGRGGMAEVHRAYDRALDRVVAVKLVPGDLRSDPDYSARLRREARAAAALSHPNAVGVFDVGAVDGDVFVVLEYVEGRTLREELADAGPRPAADAAEVAAAVCDALAAAHERGIVHRDVNPANVMRCTDGVVKLMDFGIARVPSGPEGPAGRTGTGMVLGTAAYLAPEQVRCEDLDGRTDLYALGCTLYELLTGVVPFTGDSDVEMAASRLHERPRPPRDVVGSVPAPLESVVLRALARHPDDRPADAAEMAADLRAAVRTSRAGGGAGGVGGADGTVTVGLDVTRTDAMWAGPAVSGTAPTAGESEPWSVVRRIGFVLVGCAMVVLLVVAVVALVR